MTRRRAERSTARRFGEVRKTSYYNRLRRKNTRKRFWRNHKRLRRNLQLSCFVLLAVFGIIGFLKPGVNQAVRGWWNQVLPAFRATDANFQPDEPSAGTATVDPDSIPDFSGEDYIYLNGNQPNFTEYDKTHIVGEHYSALDWLGRCGPAYAMIDRSMMPTEERGEIGMVKPSGWHTVTYPDLIESRYLYNRSHLIAFALTGENANERNLITGTRYMNATSMLPFEIDAMQYLDDYDNHVLYRVTPLFRGNELVARGVEMEAYSVEDHGAGLCFHVFVYNHQPGIEIDYATGESWEAGD